MMSRIYPKIVTSPGKYISAFLFCLVLLWAAPSFLALQRAPLSLSIAVVPCDKSLQWASVVLQIGGFAMVLLGGLIPIAKWWTDAVQKIVDDKPIVVTDRRDDGRLEITNVGNAPAVNVWLVVETGSPMPLGALNAHQSRTLSAAATETLNRPECGRHLIIAGARPNTQRPYTATFNIHSGLSAGSLVHGFRPQPVTNASLRCDGSIEEYLRHHRTTLFAELNAFTVTTEGGV